MNYLTTFFISVLITSYNPNKKIPEKMPSDFKIEYNYDGGMVDMHHNIILQLGDCRDKGKEYDGPDFDYAWKNDAQNEFENLYAELYKINAFTIPYVSKGPPKDRGGTSLLFRIDGKEYKVNDSQGDFINPEYSSVFSKVVELIQMFTNKYHNK